MNFRTREILYTAEFTPQDINFRGDNFQRAFDLVMEDIIGVLEQQIVLAPAGEEITRSQATWNAAVQSCIAKIKDRFETNGL